MDRSAHCCLCGEPRRPTQAMVDGFGNTADRIVQMNEHRPMQDGRWEQSPQMIVNVFLYRNGGTAPGQTHICDGCIVVGLRHAKDFVDGALAALDAPPPPASPAVPLPEQAQGGSGA